MALSYYDVQSKPQTRIANSLIYLNGIIAMLVIFYWPLMERVLGAPARWAMRAGISTYPGWLDYPYVALWLTPVLCALASWLALKAERFTVSRLIGLYPSLTLIVTLGWFYFVPSQWH